MKKATKLVLAIFLITFVSCNWTSKQSISTDSADAIYYGGDIITMEGDSANVEAIISG